MYHVSAQGVDERMINVHIYYYYYNNIALINADVWKAGKEYELLIKSSVCDSHLSRFLTNVNNHNETTNYKRRKKLKTFRYVVTQNSDNWFCVAS